jgi:magnesium chelatase accessory protein
MGQGPVALLVHGTGASTHSWRDLAPLLARDFTIVAPDLPGHAFTAMPDADRMTLPGMAAALAELLQVLDLDPRLVIGHSAGAAILVQMALDGAIIPAGLIALNGALLPIGGLAGQIFSPLAKLLTRSSIAPRLFAWQAGDPAVVERLIGQTGSKLDAVGLSLYGRLACHPGHTAGALAMMAHWDLVGLARTMPRLTMPLLLVVGTRDRSIPPEDAIRIRDRVPGAKLEYLRGLGHLAHEERPALVADLIRCHAAVWSLMAAAKDHAGL